LEERRRGSEQSSIECGECTVESWRLKRQEKKTKKEEGEKKKKKNVISTYCIPESQYYVQQSPSYICRTEPCYHTTHIYTTIRYRTSGTTTNKTTISDTTTDVHTTCNTTNATRSTKSKSACHLESWGTAK